MRRVAIDGFAGLGTGETGGVHVPGDFFSFLLSEYAGQTKEHSVAYLVWPTAVIAVIVLTLPLHLPDLSDCYPGTKPGRQVTAYGHRDPGGENCSKISTPCDQTG